MDDLEKGKLVESKVTPITAGRTDQQIAGEYADRMLKLLNQVTEVLNEARREHGMTISFGYTPPNQFGIQTLASLEVSKKLC
jgi:hypothetical protein